MPCQIELFTGMLNTRMMCVYNAACLVPKFDAHKSLQSPMYDSGGHLQMGHYKSNKLCPMYEQTYGKAAKVRPCSLQVTHHQVQLCF